MKEQYEKDCPDYLKKYLTYIRVVKDKGDRTEEAYYIDIRTFLRYLKIKNGLEKESDFSKITIADVSIETVANVTLDDAHEFLIWLKDKRDNSTVTRARKATAIRQFYSYLTHKTDFLKTNPLEELETPKHSKPLPKFLTLSQSQSLLDAVNADTSDRIDIQKNVARDYCILLLFLNCGMRLSELCGINKKDINFEDKTLRLLGKGRKERIVYLNESCIEAINAYLTVRNKDTVQTDALFLSNRNTRISKRRVQEIVERYIEKAGLSNTGVTTHKLRHTAATLMYNNGVDTLVLKDVLGHESIATTEIYTHLTNDNLKQAAEMNPLAHKKKKKQ